MSMKTCKFCGPEVRMKEAYINYTKEILHQTVTIKDVEGFKCTQCGYEEINDALIEGIKTKLLEKKLEIFNNLDIKMLLISRLKKTRQDKKVAQKVVGKALKMKEQHFGAIERNYNIPSIYTAYKIADVFGVDINELYERVYVPSRFADKLRNMNEEFNEIEGLQEQREKLVDIEKRIREHLKLKRSKKVIDLDKFEETKTSLYNTKEAIESEIERLEKSAAFKQGNCIDYETWEILKVKYSTEIEIYEIDEI